LNNLSFMNYDSSFFTVETDDIKQYDPLYGDIAKRVISFEITEEIGKLPHGTLSILDEDDDMFSWFLKMGKKVKIRWGYKNIDYSGKKLYDIGQGGNPKEIFAPGIVSRYCEARIKDPSGAGGSDGKKTYNCSFINYDLSAWGNKVFNQRGFTKQTVVTQVFLAMGITTPIVSFRRGNEPVFGDTAIRQDSVSNFRFLNALSMEWRTIFRVGFTKVGTQIGLFCDYDDDKAIQTFILQTAGAFGDTLLLEWKYGNANVKSFSWSHNEGGNGSGDNVQLQYINGQPQFYKTIATTESVKVYRLDVQKIQNEFSSLSNNSAAIGKHTDLLMQSNTLDELVAKKYYVPAMATTAPQGAGFSVQVEAIGDPLCIAPCRIKFGRGFPDLLQIKGLIFYVQSVTHKIDNTGYNMTLKIQDCVSITGGSMVG